MATKTKSTKVICFANNKGGSGKSTTCANVGYALAQMGKRVLLLDGDMQLSDFCELMDWDEDELDAESATVGGWTIEMHGDFPKVGEGFTHDGVVLEVLEMDGLRVERVLVKKIEE